MRKWEDIVKDKLEGYESTLPEGSLASFRALREGKKAASARNVAPWIWGVTAAAAAGLAAILFLRQPAVPENVIQVVPQPSAPVAAVDDSADVIEPIQAEPLVALAAKPKVIRQADEQPQEVTAVTLPEGETVTPEEMDPDVPEPIEDETVDNIVITTPVSPVLPEPTGRKPVQMKVAPAAGMVAGGGLLAAVIGPLGIRKAANPSSNKIALIGDPASPDEPGSPFYYGDSGKGTGDVTNNPIKGTASHSFPLILGLSARIPVAERLYVSTGLEYSLYQSTFTFPTQKMRQTAHYLGVPVRLDWVFASNRFFDVYVGGGLAGDVCVGASLSGNNIAKDGFSLSALGAGGIQLNVTRRLGLYVEPVLNWRMPVGQHGLETYRSQHPLMFSVVGGLRITVGK